MTLVGDFLLAFFNMFGTGGAAAPAAAPAAAIPGVPPVIAAIPVPAVVPAPNPPVAPVAPVPPPIVIAGVALWLTNHGPPAGVSTPLDGLRLQLAMAYKAKFEQKALERYQAAMPNALANPGRAAAKCRKSLARAIASGAVLLRPIIGNDQANFIGFPFRKIKRSRTTVRTHDGDTYARFAGVEFETQDMFKYCISVYVIHRMGQGMTVLEAKALADGALKGYVCARCGVASNQITRVLVV